jgi:hypothetical protein
VCLLAARSGAKLKQALDEVRLIVEIKGRDKQGHEHMQIRALLIALKPTDLHFAVADRDRHLALAELRATSQKLQVVAERRK